LSLFGVKTGVFYNESSRRTTHFYEKFLKIRTIQQQELRSQIEEKGSKKRQPEDMIGLPLCFYYNKSVLTLVESLSSPTWGCWDYSRLHDIQMIVLCQPNTECGAY